MRDSSPCMGYGDYGYGIHRRRKPKAFTKEPNRTFDAYVSARVYFVSTESLKSIAQGLAAVQIPLSISDWKESFSEYVLSEIKKTQDGLYKAAEDAISMAIRGMSLKIG